MCAQRQREILRSAAQLVRPGGRLVYSTCTFAPAENEQVISAFLQEHTEFAPDPVDAPWFTAGENGSYRMWPHKLLGEGHFAAVLRKKETDGGSAQEEPGVKLPAEWLAFAKEMDIVLPGGKAVQFGQSLYWAPEDMPSIRGLKVERPGLELGVVKKGRFEPAHALALWLKTCSRIQPLSGAELTQYMAGNVVSSHEKGWTLVQIDGYSMGWGKGDGTVLKNHYPKGLRRPV